MFAFLCPKCQATLRAPEEKIGARTKCPYCQCPVQVPSGPDSPVAVYAVPVASNPIGSEVPPVEISRFARTSEQTAPHKLAWSIAGLLVLLPIALVAALAFSWGSKSSETSGHAVAPAQGLPVGSESQAERVVDKPNDAPAPNGKPETSGGGETDRQSSSVGSADDLFAAYEKDAVAAESKYTGKVVLLSVRCNVEKDQIGRWLIQDRPKAEGGAQVMSVDNYLRSAYESIYGGQRPKYGEYLYLSKSKLKSFEGLNGRRIVLRGLCSGMEPDRNKKTIPNFVVVVRDCTAETKPYSDAELAAKESLRKEMDSLKIEIQSLNLTQQRLNEIGKRLDYEGLKKLEKLNGKYTKLASEYEAKYD
jgi:hypothetical protein